MSNSSNWWSVNKEFFLYKLSEQLHSSLSYNLHVCVCPLKGETPKSHFFVFTLIFSDLTIICHPPVHTNTVNAEGKAVGHLSLRDPLVTL